MKWAAPSGASFKGVRLEKSSSQAVANTTYTSITYDVETFDTDGFHSTVSNTSRITIPTGLGGYYLVAFQMTWTANGSGFRLARIYRNNTTAVYLTSITGSSVIANSIVGTTTLNLSAGDYIELQGYQDTGGNLNNVGNNENTGMGRFEAYYLGV